MAVEDAVLKLLRFIRLKDTGEKKSSDNALLLTVYLTACVGSLLSVALFGYKYSIVEIFVGNSFTQFKIHTLGVLSFAWLSIINA